MSRFRAPSASEVQAALLMIPTSQLRRVFYEGLRNPLWVRPLFKLGAFNTPPEPEHTTDGYIRDTYWPEISYLTRIATEVPTDVVDVLLSLIDSNNAWVRRAVFEIGSKIPAAEGVRLRALLEAWRTTSFGWRTDPSDMVSFAIALLNGGETKAGRWLANALFAPQPTAVDNALLQRPRFELEDYWYQEELPRLVPALGNNALKAVTGWLVSFVKLSGHVQDDYDSSGIVRAAIAERDDSFGEPEDSLVEMVRDLAVPGMLEKPEETMKVLLSSGVSLLHKIALYATAKAIRVSLNSGASTQGLIDVAKQLLSSPASNDIYSRVEYARLAQTAVEVDTTASSAISEFIASAYEHDLDWMREKLPNPDTGEALSEAEIQERATRYKHSWLAAIGANALPQDLRVELARLDEELGPIDHPVSPLGSVTSWSGPNPYSSQDEMVAMSAPELVAHLASWRDTGNGWGPEPSHEGQGRELAALLTTHPRALSGVSDLAVRLRPTYLRAVLQGWEAALKAGLELDWPEVADLVSAVLTHPNQSSFPVEGGTMDDDKDFRWAKNATVGLLEELVKNREGVTIPADLVGRFAEILVDRTADEEAWLEYDAYERDEGKSDPLTMSLNWQWPKRLRALFSLATQDRTAPWQSAAFAVIESELARTDRHGAGRAVLGEHVGKLLVSVPEWIKPRLVEYFGTAEGVSVSQQIALTTAIAIHRYHRDLYEMLSGPMIAAVAVGDDLANGWGNQSAPSKRIGEWVISALIHGDITASDPLATAFFTGASAGVRGEAMQSIASSFSRAEAVDDAIRARYELLWDDRIQHVREHPQDHEELKGFYWAAKGNNISTEWWLPRLKDALELEPGLANERYMIGKELAAASAQNPQTALTIVRLLVAARDAGNLVSFDLNRNAVPAVIANAMSFGNARLKGEAERFMNELGAKGNLELEADVNAVRLAIEPQADAGD